MSFWGSESGAPWSRPFNGDYWKMGMNGAMFQMIAHGISSAGMFFLVGVIYDRVHHRDLDKFGGLFAKMPVYSGMAILIFFAGLGLPGFMRVHWRSAGGAQRLEFQHHSGCGFCFCRDSHCGLYSLGDSKGLPGSGIQRAPPRSAYADHAT